MGYSSISIDMNLKLVKMKTLLRFRSDFQCHGAIASHIKIALPQYSEGITMKTDPSQLFLHSPPLSTSSQQNMYS